MRRDLPAASSTAAMFSEVVIEEENLTGMDRIRIFDFRFLICDWKKPAPRIEPTNRKSKIANQKSCPSCPSLLNFSD
jgi:hypothetical protein